MCDKLKILKNTVHVGLEKPIKLLHITDSHITRDDPWHSRAEVFDTEYKGCTEDFFFAALDYAKQNNMPILHTGDLIDFFSKGNFDFIDEYFDGVDYMYAAGNHDFCHMLGEAEEDYDYKWEKIREIAPHFNCNLYFDSRVTGGINIVTLDNSYYFISRGQIEALKAEAARGYPIILAMHVPIHAETLTNMTPTGKPAYVMAAPKNVLAHYTEDRRLQQTPDAATLQAVEYIKSEPLIKAVVTGHKHMNHEDMLTENLIQFVTHGTFAGYVREITID